MERLDFASVMTVLRRNINEELCPKQLLTPGNLSPAVRDFIF